MEYLAPAPRSASTYLHFWNSAILEFVQYEKKVKRPRTSGSQTTGAAIGLLALGLVAGVAACWVKATHRPVVWFIIGLVAAGTTLALGALSLVARWMDSSSSGL